MRSVAGPLLNRIALVGIRIDGFLSASAAKSSPFFSLSRTNGLGGGTNDDDLQRTTPVSEACHAPRNLCKREDCPGNENRGHQAPVIVSRHRDRFAENSELIADNNGNDVPESFCLPCTLCHNDPVVVAAFFI